MPLNDTTVLLAFAEGRTNCGDFTYHDLLCKRSFDSGRTWSATCGQDGLALVNATKTWGFAAAGSYNGTSNSTAASGSAIFDPTPVYDGTTGEVFLFFQLSPWALNTASTQRKPGHAIFVMSSTDAGASWTAPKNLTYLYDGSQAKAVGVVCDASDTSWCEQDPAGGHGIQLSSGRLLVPSYHANGQSCILYSDNHGKSWTIGPQFHSQGGGSKLGDAFEGAVVELFDGAGVLVHVRTDGPFQCLPDSSVISCQRGAVSTDGGLTFGEWKDQSAIPTPAVRGGLARWGAGKGLVTANCADQSRGDGQRVNTTVRISLDNGNTWPHSVLIDTLGGYVTVEMISEDLIGVLYDKGADCGPVAFASINATELVSRTI